MPTAPWPRNFASLGFIDGEHYLSATAADLEQVARAVHPAFYEEADAIRRRGHALVHAKHTIEHRAQAIETICGDAPRPSASGS